MKKGCVIFWLSLWLIFFISFQVHAQKVYDGDNPETLYERLDVAKAKADTAEIVDVLQIIIQDQALISDGENKRRDELREELIDILSLNPDIPDSLQAKANLNIGMTYARQILPHYSHSRDSVTNTDFYAFADTARNWLNKNLKLKNIRNGDLSWTFHNLAALNFHLKRAENGDLSQCLEWAEKSIYFAEKSEDGYLPKTFAHIIMARCYAHQKKYNMAFEALETAFDIQEEHQPMNRTTELWDAYLGIYLQKTNSDTLHWIVENWSEEMKKKVTGQYQKELAASDRLYKTREARRDLEQQSRINELQRVQLNQRNLIIAVTALLLLGAGLGSLILYRLNRKNQKLAENNAMLVKEQNHRVKNNLQMISSLLSLQADRADDSSKETMLISSRRVQAIALLHRRLYDDLDGVKEVEIKTYIEELIQDILFATGKQDVPLRLNLENVSLPVEKAVHLALILNELITNSLKHVFSRARLNGECIELSLAKPDGQIELTYRDNGGSFDVEAFKTSDSLGNQIILSQAAHLAQEFEVADEDGMKFEMKFAT